MSEDKSKKPTKPTIAKKQGTTEASQKKPFKTAGGMIKKPSKGGKKGK